MVTSFKIEQEPCATFGFEPFAQGSTVGHCKVLDTGPQTFWNGSLNEITTNFLLPQGGGEVKKES